MNNITDNCSPDPGYDPIAALATLLRRDPAGVVRAEALLKAYVRCVGKEYCNATTEPHPLRLVYPSEPTKKRKPAG